MKCRAGQKSVGPKDKLDFHLRRRLSSQESLLSLVSTSSNAFMADGVSRLGETG